MTKRVLMLVEGQTEEIFVKTVLAPAFHDREIYIVPTLLVTKRVKSGTNFKGGVTSFSNFEKDLSNLLPDSSAIITTLLDYYGLPNDFPGMTSMPKSGTPIEKVCHVEQAIFHHFDSPKNFMPFLALHEFEAWLFSSPVELPRAMTDMNAQAVFESVRAAVKTPEDINNSPESAPSKRIAKLFPAYKKILHGPIVAQRIGLEKIRKECPHFNEWIHKLENINS